MEQQMDSFSALAILEAAKTDPSGAADLYKTMKSDSAAPTLKDAEWVKAHIGNAVQIIGTSLTGVITSLNEASCGFYPGSRYPARVTLESGDTFEYELRQLKLS